MEKLHNEELYDQYSSTKYYSVDQIKKNFMGGACSKYGERRGICRVLVVKPEGKRPLGRSRRRWKDNIKMDPQEVGWGSINWVDRAQKMAGVELLLMR